MNIYIYICVYICIYIHIYIYIYIGFAALGLGFGVWGFRVEGLLIRFLDQIPGDRAFGS